MEFYQIKNILHSKGNNDQSEETSYGMGENLCHLFTWQGIYIQRI
jgi:hypothetical protein